MSRPLVSVIIPNYNHGRFLKQRVNSVLRQTYQNIEVIILDDCSPDNSREVISEFSGSPLIRQILFNDQNSGSPFLQWQRGTEFAQGEWLWFAESDDYADVRFLELTLAAIGDRKNVGLVYCDSRIVAGDLVSAETFSGIKNKRYHTSRWSLDHGNNGLEEIETYLLPGGTINNASAVLFNKKKFVESNPFDMDLRYIGDKYAFIKVLANSEVVYVHDCLNYYRDPFNRKHSDKMIFYFYEQFRVFDWVYRNLPLNKKKFNDAFFANTQQSLFRGWGKTKWSIYRKLFGVNRLLLVRSIFNNLWRSLASIAVADRSGQFQEFN